MDWLWIRICSGQAASHAQLRAPPLSWFGDYIHGFLHISYMSFTESHPTSILGNEDLWGGKKTCVIINLILKRAAHRMEMRRILLHFIVL